MNSKRTKFTALDGILLLALVLGGGWLAYRASVKVDYAWNWPLVFNYIVRYDPVEGWTMNLLLEGLLTTIRLSVWSTLLAAVIGGVMGLCRTSPLLFFRLVSRTYVEAVRNLPPLVLIFIVYFFLSEQLMGVLGVDDLVRTMPESLRNGARFFFDRPERLTSFFAALLTLSLYEGAYIAEIVRAGVQSVEKGQWEAASALGLSTWQRMRHVILPLTVQRILPPLAGQFISTIKDSAIVAVISVQELTFQGLELMASTFRTFEIWITVGVMYLVLCLACSLIARRLELYLSRSEA